MLDNVTKITSNAWKVLKMHEHVVKVSSNAWKSFQNDTSRANKYPTSCMFGEKGVKTKDLFTEKYTHNEIFVAKQVAKTKLILIYVNIIAKFTTIGFTFILWNAVCYTITLGDKIAVTDNGIFFSAVPMEFNILMWS